MSLISAQISLSVVMSSMVSLGRKDVCVCVWVCEWTQKQYSLKEALIPTALRWFVIAFHIATSPPPACSYTCMDAIFNSAEVHC